MKPTLLMLVCLFATFTINAQNTPLITKTDSVYTNVDQQAEYPGGLEKLYEFLGRTLQYTDSARTKKVQGKVFVTYVVEKDGSLTDMKVLRGLSSDIDAEAIRVMKLTPKWQPAVKDGQTVRSQYTALISFTLAEEVFMTVESAAEYPRGIERFYTYIMSSLKYPKKAKDDNIEGKVMVSFVVEKDGTLTDIKVVRSLSPETDAEAIRLIKGSVKWKAGMQGGRTVRQQYTLPVNFNLSGDR